MKTLKNGKRYRANSMDISVIIPMYNSENTIIRTLNSIKRQTYLSYIKEILIINDGSTDNSVSIVNKYKEENPTLPIILINKVNGGVSSARNEGLKQSLGNWIALLDADDEWLADKLEVQVRTINDHSNIDFLGGSIDNKSLKILWRKVDYLYEAELKDLCIKVFPQTSTAIFRRKIFEEIGGYDETQKYGEDANYFMKICNKYSYYYLPYKVVVYDGGKPSFGFSGLSSNLKKMHEGVIKNIWELRNEKLISRSFYIFLLIFNNLKYLKRIINTNIRKLIRFFNKKNGEI